MTPTRYLASCELELGRLQEAIDNDLMGRLELLAGDALTDEASRARAHGLTDDDFADVWLTAAWPLKVSEVAEQAEEKLEDDRMTFQDQLRRDQEAFAEELDAWEAEVKALA